MDEIWDELEIFMEVMAEIRLRKARRKARQRKVHIKKQQTQRRNWSKWKKISGRVVTAFWQ
ncbi:hypothetical protein [Bacillus wiedmannii]|uniref:hypothetical protein n=1 Tax=Bacillus wiedmannii TaxID=1890302 RepID=UPI0021D09E2B|nr:hypothetical protein [Bacillus wiedmannii]MCU5097880.1 hypothetical protein [Bacillus wiedmannii]